MRRWFIVRLLTRGFCHRLISGFYSRDLLPLQNISADCLYVKVCVSALHFVGVSRAECKSVANVLLAPTYWRFVAVPPKLQDVLRNDNTKFFYNWTSALSQIRECDWFLILYIYHKLTEVHFMCLYKNYEALSG